VGRGGGGGEGEVGRGGTEAATTEGVTGKRGGGGSGHVGGAVPNALDDVESGRSCGVSWRV